MDTLPPLIMDQGGGVKGQGVGSRAGDPPDWVDERETMRTVVICHGSSCPGDPSLSIRVIVFSGKPLVTALWRVILSVSQRYPKRGFVEGGWGVM